MKIYPNHLESSAAALEKSISDLRLLDSQVTGIVQSLSNDWKSNSKDKFINEHKQLITEISIAIESLHNQIAYIRQTADLARDAQHKEKLARLNDHH
ncbi:uncharacterized protein YukE [Scopulibacillus daqui]|uniref:Uncharacterized protein YukE n=1 Tax=Scopulibacillus daqui TaxID=1469162 RepID=A0ABS2PV76_9BACL|nr:uncharacterized protein YukE [Scopulibacillus daqui]